MAGSYGSCEVDFLKYLCKMYSCQDLQTYKMKHALHEEWEELNAMIWVCTGLISVVVIWYHRVILIDFESAPQRQKRNVKI